MKTEEYRDAQEHLDRLRAMEQDSGETWDLSENDQLAIKFALHLLGENAKEITELRALVGELADFIRPTIDTEGEPFSEWEANARKLLSRAEEARKP